MLVLLNAYSVVETDSRAIRLATQMYVDGIRRDVLWSLTDESLDRVVQQSKQEDHLQWLYIVGGKGPGRPLEPSTAQFASNAAKVANAVKRNGAPKNILFNLGLEAAIEDPYREQPDLYVDSVNAAATVIWGKLPKAKIVVTLSNTPEHKDFIEYVAIRLNPGIHMGVHTYRTRKTPRDPVPGFSSRGAEFAFLHMVASHDNRELWNTETGWHTAKMKWGLCDVLGGFGNWLSRLLTGRRCQLRLTEEEVGRFLIDEIKIHQQNGVKAFCIYQAFTGISNNPEDLFGMMDHQGNMKPRARIVAAYLKGRHDGEATRAAR